MTKSFADHCLELSSRAIKGPWHYSYEGSGDYSIGPNDPQINSIAQTWRNHNDREQGSNDCAFIAASRDMVPELARRLKIACEYLRAGDYSDESFIDELEAMPEEK